jgi:hypothetical protein
VTAFTPPRRGALAALALATLAVTGAARAAEPAAAAGPRAEAEAWTVALELPAGLRAGAPATARVRVTARAGYHVNLEYPAAFKPDAGATVTFAGARVPLAAASAEKVACAGHATDTCQAAFALPFTPGDRPARLAGTVSFSVCTADRCLIERVALAAGP